MSDLCMDDRRVLREMKQELPDKPSELLAMALEDLEKIEADPRYKINMGTWHSPSFYSKDICEVCLAGAVMACRDGLTPKDDADPVEFEPDVRRKFVALNCLREGNVADALALLGIPGRFAFMDEFGDCYLDRNHDSLESGGDLGATSADPSRRKEWKLHMIDLIGILRAERL